MTTVNHPCRKHNSGPFEWCVHEACRPQGRISEELKRMDKPDIETVQKVLEEKGARRERGKPATGPDAVQNAAEFLMKAYDEIQAAEAEITGLDREMKKLAVRQEELHEKIRTLREKSGPALNVIAATFGHTHVQTKDPEENYA